MYTYYLGIETTPRQLIDANIDKNSAALLDALNRCDIMYEISPDNAISSPSVNYELFKKRNIHLNESPQKTLELFKCFIDKTGRNLLDNKIFFLSYVVSVEDSQSIISLPPGNLWVMIELRKKFNMTRSPILGCWVKTG